MNVDHEVYETLILRLPDGDLTEDEKQALQKHLNTCAECRRLFLAIRSVTMELDELSEPPAALASRVMERISAAESEQITSEPTVGRRDLERRKLERRKRRRRSIGAFAAMAAVLVLVVGGGIFAARKLLNSSGSKDSVQQSVAMDTSLTAAAREEPEASEAAPAAAEAAGGTLFDTYGAVLEETREADAGTPAEPAAAAANESAADSSSAAPARVRAGCESDFEALLGDAGWADGEPSTPWLTIALVEYRGVIYEFLTDPEGKYLLWRDSAESVDLIHSPAAPGELWPLIE